MKNYRQLFQQHYVYDTSYHFYQKRLEAHVLNFALCTLTVSVVRLVYSLESLLTDTVVSSTLGEGNIVHTYHTWQRERVCCLSYNIDTALQLAKAEKPAVCVEICCPEDTTSFFRCNF